MLIALSALILCTVTFSRKAKSKVAGAWDECKPLCEKDNLKPKVYQHKDFGKNDVNKKFICECEGAAENSSKFYVMDVDFEQEFKTVPSKSALGAINSKLFKLVKHR